MDGNPISLARAAERISSKSLRDSTERIIEFYEHAGLDYEHWSSGFNMHLGFYRRGMNPFDREAMLEQMNLEVARRLYLDADKECMLIDLGCGMGSIARTVARHYSRSLIKGITLSPSQVRIASELNAEAGLADRIGIMRGDYVRLPIAGRSADGLWAVESACYARGADKDDLISEMARVLKTGGRFVVADCFVHCHDREFNRVIARCYRTACDGWALTEMPAIEAFVHALQRHGFRDIIVENISWRVAPSLAHAPLTVLTFVIKKVLAGEPFNRHSINNLKASLLALMLGLNRSKFSYCLISGTFEDPTNNG
jgi:ubiquinone/menaquinone biosynthesis C-methylase UbiE